MDHFKNKSLDNIEEIVDGLLIKEVWIPVFNNEDTYLISNFSRVKRIVHSHKYPTKIISQAFDKNGYLSVGLYQDAKTRKTYRMARLMLLSFKVPNPENKSQVNHKKGIKTDNRLWELEWNTNAENQQHAIRTGLKKFKNGEDVSFSKLTNDQAKYIFNSNKSINYLTKEMLLPRYVISYVKRGVAWNKITGAEFKNSRTELTDLQIQEILSSNDSYSKLAKKYGVSKCYIRDRKKGRLTWRQARNKTI